MDTREATRGSGATRVALTDGSTVVITPTRAAGGHTLAIENRRGRRVALVVLTAGESQAVADRLGAA